MRLDDYYDEYYRVKIGDIRELNYGEDFYLRAPGSHYYHSVTMLKRILAADYAGARPRVIEIGIGSGAMMQWFRHQGIEPLGFDISKHLVEQMQAKNFDARLADLNETALPAGDSSADIVLSLNVIEHVIDPRFYMSEIARVCAPGGHAIISTDNSRTFKRIAQLLFGGGFPWTSQERSGWDCGHLHYFTSKDVATLARGNGFEVAENVGVSTMGHDFRGSAKKALFALMPAGFRREFFCGAFILHFRKASGSRLQATGSG